MIATPLPPSSEKEGRGGREGVRREAFELACVAGAEKRVSGMWRVEKMDPEDGGPVGWGLDSPFRLRYGRLDAHRSCFSAYARLVLLLLASGTRGLEWSDDDVFVFAVLFLSRHVSTGQYLSLGEFGGSGVSLSEAGEAPGPTTLLCVEEAFSQRASEGAVTWQAYILLRSAVMPTYLKVVEGVMSAGGVGHPNDAVCLMREDERDVSDVYQVVSTRSSLYGYLKVLRRRKDTPNGAPQPPSNYTHSFAADLMVDLEHFCQPGGDKGEIVRRRRQLTVMHLGVLHLLVHISTNLQIRAQNVSPASETQEIVVPRAQSMHPLQRRQLGLCPLIAILDTRAFSSKSAPSSLMCCASLAVRVARRPAA